MDNGLLLMVILAVLFVVMVGCVLFVAFVWFFSGKPDILRFFESSDRS